MSKLSRRDFLKLTGVGVSGAAAALALAGCKKGEETTGGATGTTAGGEVPTIKVQMTCLTVPKDLKMVEEKISEITREKIGCNVEIIALETANQTDKLNLLLSAGDDSIDIFFKGSLSETVANGQALDITEYIEQYKDEMIAEMQSLENCQDIRSVVGEKDEYFYSIDIMAKNYAMIAMLVYEKDIPRTLATLTRHNCKIYPSPTPLYYFTRHPFSYTKPQLDLALKQLQKREEFADIKTLETWNGSSWVKDASVEGERSWTCSGTATATRRLTWRWRKLIPGYVTDGLVVHLGCPQAIPTVNEQHLFSHTA